MTAATWGGCCPAPRRPGELLTRGDVCHVHADRAAAERCGVLLPARPSWSDSMRFGPRSTGAGRPSSRHTATPDPIRPPRQVRARVLESTDGQQRPHEYGSLLREHYLSGVARPGPVAVAAADGAAARLQQETVFW